jgi:thiamine-phosphate pyrophosphorylase
MKSESGSGEPARAADRMVALRILDANANRAAEGLRVAEEYVRFGQNRGPLALAFKELRHALAEVLRAIPTNHRLDARDTTHDVGTETTTPQEQARRDARDVAAAGIKRCEQALRCLEEYAKTDWPVVAAAVEPLRYRLYTLEKLALRQSPERDLLVQARLYVLIDGGAGESDFVSRVAALLAAGVPLLQLRDKSLNDRSLLSRARCLRDLTRDTPTLIVINDRVDLAVLADADGVHVGQDEIAVADARRLLGPDKLIGVSTHNARQVQQALDDGADYLGCGPTFPSATKQFQQLSGLDFLRSQAGRVLVPAFAIGGIHAGNLADVLRTGFTRVAVQHAVWNALDGADVARNMLRALAADGG